MPLRRRFNTGGPDPTVPVKGKRARIIANSQYPEFSTEFQRAKDQYLKHYPGGVDFVEAGNYDELKKAFGSLGTDQDLIMMTHYNEDSMFRTPVSDPSMRGLNDVPDGQTLSTLFKGLQDRGYNGNCYLGICHGENTAKAIQSQGVNIPMFAAPGEQKWFGTNPGNKESFEDFFFGVRGSKAKAGDPVHYNDSVNSYTTQAIDPELGKDYKLLLSERRQELMKRRASATPVNTVAPLKEVKLRFGGKFKYATGGPYEDDLAGFYGRTNPLGVGEEETASTAKPKFNFGEGLNKILPFATNISNSFRRLPEPPRPMLEQNLNPELVNFDADRAELDRTFRSFNKGISQSTNNVAQANAAKVGTLGKILEAKGKLSQNERNTNAEIKNQTNRFNSFISGRNVERSNDYNNELFSRTLKEQQLRAENLADVSNKIQLSRRDEDMMDLENRKLGILLATDKDTGTFNRNLYDNYLGELYPKRKRFGGKLKTY